MFIGDFVEVINEVCLGVNGSFWSFVLGIFVLIFMAVYVCGLVMWNCGFDCCVYIC